MRLDEIAELAGVGVGTVYRRFKDKDALVGALFTQQIADTVARADEALETRQDGTGLRWFLERTAAAMAEDRGLMQILTSPQATADDMAVAARSQLEPRVAELARRAARAGLIRPDLVQQDMAIVMVLLGTVVDLLSQARPGLRERYTHLILDALGAGAGSGGSPLPTPEPDSDDILDVIGAWLPRPRRPGARG